MRRYYSTKQNASQYLIKDLTVGRLHFSEFFAPRHDHRSAVLAEVNGKIIAEKLNHPSI